MRKTNQTEVSGGGGGLGGEGKPFKLWKVVGCGIDGQVKCGALLTRQSVAFLFQCPMGAFHRLDSRDTLVVL